MRQLVSIVGFEMMRRRLFHGMLMAAMVSLVVWPLIWPGRGGVLAGGGSVVAGNATMTFDNDPTQPPLGPGVPQVGSSAPRSAASTTKAGSILFFSKFTSDLARPNEVNSLLTLTNTNSRDAMTVRVFFISNCVVEDRFLTLAPNQSRSLLTGTEVPGQTGYAVAVAVNAQGVPTQFNWLIGNARLRDARGHEANYNALAVAKRSAGPIEFDRSAGSWSLKFNGQDYDRLPRVVALDHVQSQDPVSGSPMVTDVAIFSPTSDLGDSFAATTKLTATIRDHNGMAYSQERETVCYTDLPIGDFWTTMPFNSIVGHNRPGWATFSARDEAEKALPMIGISLADAADEKLHGARVMQTLEWLDSYQISFPISAPENPVADVITRDQPDATGGAQGISENRAGSILLYSRFVSGKYGNSQLFITNVDTVRKVRVRAFFNGLADTAEVKETLLTIEPGRTTVLNPQDVAPDQRGWVMVVAIDSSALPIQFNHLIGSVQIRDVSGHKSGFNALAIGKNTSEAVARNKDVQTSDLLFNDEEYDRLPATSAMGFVPSQTDNQTVLGFSRAPANLLDPPVTRGAGSVVFFDDQGISYNTSMARTETRLNQLRASMTQPPVTNSLLPGEQGWLRITTSSPLFSWSLNLAPGGFSVRGNTEWQGGFDGDGNLHILTTVEKHVLQMPSVNPNNRAPVAFAETLGLQIEARRGDGTIVRLDGSSSYDEDPEDTLTYQWTDNNQPVSKARIADRRLSIGQHLLSLTVTDGSGVDSLPSEQSVKVVDSTAPQISGVPTNISKRTASDTGEAVTFPLPVAYDMVDGSVTVTSSHNPGTVFPLGVTNVTFTAADRAGNKSTARMQVRLTKGDPSLQEGGEAGNKAPFMDNLNDQYLKPGELRAVLLQANDQDNDFVSFRLLGAPAYAQIVSGDPGSRSATLRIAPGANEKSVATNVRVVIDDGRGGAFTTLPFRIMISDQVNDDTGSGESSNRLPVPVVAQLPASIKATSRNGAEVLLDASQSTDPDGDPLSFAWFDGETQIGRGAVAEVTLGVGIHSLRLTVFDGKDGLVSTTPVTIEVLPRDLRIISIAPNRLDRSSTVNLVIVGSGFTPFSEVQFGKEGIAVLNYVSVEEDRIEVKVEVSPTAVPSFRDVFVVNPNGKSVRFRSGIFVNP